MNRKQRAMKAFWAGANKADGKPVKTMVMTYSIAAAKQTAIAYYPPSQGYTDHYGVRRI